MKLGGDVGLGVGGGGGLFIRPEASTGIWSLIHAGITVKPS